MRRPTWLANIWIQLTWLILHMKYSNLVKYFGKRPLGTVCGETTTMASCFIQFRRGLSYLVLHICVYVCHSYVLGCKVSVAYWLAGTKWIDMLIKNKRQDFTHVHQTLYHVYQNCTTFISMIILNGKSNWFWSTQYSLIPFFLTGQSNCSCIIQPIIYN